MPARDVVPGNGTPAPATLSVRQRQFLTALLVNGEVVAACEQSGVSTSTAYRWLREPTFIDALREAERAAIQATSRRLARLGATAVQVLDDAMTDPTAPLTTRVRAADVVLTKLLQLRELVDMDERITALEAAIQEQERR